MGGTPGTAAPPPGLSGVSATSTAVMQPEPLVEFRADHPFIYCLTDDASGAVLFMGRMTAP
jgi:serine protease inhibitor